MQYKKKKNWKYIAPEKTIKVEFNFDVQQGNKVGDCILYLTAFFFYGYRSLGHVSMCFITERTLCSWSVAVQSPYLLPVKSFRLWLSITMGTTGGIDRSHNGSLFPEPAAVVPTAAIRRHLW